MFIALVIFHILEMFRAKPDSSTGMPDLCLGIAEREKYLLKMNLSVFGCISKKRGPE
jgi:hypothetical protein